MVVACALINGAACSIGHSCSEIGCVNGVDVRIAPDGNVWQDGDYVVELSLEGAVSSCAFSIPEDLPARGQDTSLDCGYLSQLAACREVRTSDAISQVCEPIEGEYELRLTAWSEPSSLELTLTRDGDVVLEHSKKLVYRESTPNGPECAPVCRNASVELTF